MLSTKTDAFAQQTNYQISSELNIATENLRKILKLLLDLAEEMASSHIFEVERTEYSKSWLKSLQKMQSELGDFETRLLDKSKLKADEKNDAKWVILCKWVEEFIQFSLAEIVTDTLEFIRITNFEFEEVNCLKELENINAKSSISLAEEEQQVLIRIYTQFAKDLKSLNKSTVPSISPYILSKVLESEVNIFKLFLEQALEFRSVMERHQTSSGKLGLEYQLLKAIWPKQNYLQSAQNTLIEFESYLKKFSSFSVNYINDRKYEDKCQQLSRFIRATIENLRKEILKFLEKISNIFNHKAGLGKTVSFFERWDLDGKEVSETKRVDLKLAFSEIKLVIPSLVSNLESEKNILFLGQEEFHRNLLKHMIKQMKKIILNMDGELKDAFSTFFYKISIGIECKNKLPEAGYLDFCIEKLEQSEKNDLLLAMVEIFGELGVMFNPFETLIKNYFRENIENTHWSFKTDVTELKKNELMDVYWVKEMKRIFYSDIMDETKLTQSFAEIDSLFLKLQEELERLVIWCINIEKLRDSKSTGEVSLKAEESSFFQKDTQLNPLSPDGKKNQESIQKAREFFDAVLSRKIKISKPEQKLFANAEQKLSDDAKLDINPPLQLPNNTPTLFFSSVKPLQTVEAAKLITTISIVNNLVSSFLFDGRQQVIKQLYQLYKTSIPLKAKQDASEEVQAVLSEFLDLLKTVNASLSEGDKKMIGIVLKTNLGFNQFEQIEPSKLNENRLKH